MLPDAAFAASPTAEKNMHIPDGYLGPATYCGLWATMVPFWTIASRKVKDQVRTAQVPYLAMGAVFSLVAMMFVLPLPGGTTGHISGTALVAILLGPWPAVIAVSISLMIQAVVMGDGGITAMGANCFNVAVIGAFCSSGMYRLVLRLMPADGKKTAGMVGTQRRAVAAAIASYAAINLGALTASIELGIQPLIYDGIGHGSSYFPFPMKVVIPATMLPHLTAIGALEAIVTALVISFLDKKEGSLKIISSFIAFLLPLTAALEPTPSHAHSIHYQVEQRGMAVRAYYGGKKPAANSQYELLGPGDKEPHQTGRTDRNGYIGFVPDRPGTWKLRVWGESSHGFHGVTTEIRIDNVMNLESFSKPLVATYTKFVTGISLLIGIFGLYSFLLSRKRRGGSG